MVEEQLWIEGRFNWFRTCFFSFLFRISMCLGNKVEDSWAALVEVKSRCFSPPASFQRETSLDTIWQLIYIGFSFMHTYTFLILPETKEGRQMKARHRSHANGLILHNHCLIFREKHFISVNALYRSPREGLSLAPVTFFACELTLIIISIVALAMVGMRMMRVMMMMNNWLICATGCDPRSQN